MPRVIQTITTLPDAHVDSLKRQQLTTAHDTTLITGEDVDVLKPDGSRGRK